MRRLAPINGGACGINSLLAETSAICSPDVGAKSSECNAEADMTAKSLQEACGSRKVQLDSPDG